MQVVLASNNAKKLAELSSLFAGLAVELIAQGQIGITEAEEPHPSFVENALAKARHASVASGAAALADDSGLSVHVLGGSPGVHSARFAVLDADRVRGLDREAGRRVQDTANNTELLARLRGITDRRAAFVSVLVAVRHASDPEPLIATARWSGVILDAPRGAGGFGYDPLMFIPELGCSVAELTAAQKNAASHRALAARAMGARMQSQWQV